MMTIERNHHGAYVITAIINGYLVTRQYYGYTKRDAIREFKTMMEGMN